VVGKPHGTKNQKQKHSKTMTLWTIIIIPFPLPESGFFFFSSLKNSVEFNPSAPLRVSVIPTVELTGGASQVGLVADTPTPPLETGRERERERNCCWCWWIALGDRLEEEEEERGTPSSELACGCRFLKHLCGDLMGLEEPLVVIRAVFWERALRYVAAAQRVAC